MQQESLESAESRKRSHIELAFQSIEKLSDNRFYYEPMLIGNSLSDLPVSTLASKQMKAPIWISSMTGGTAQAGPINKILAKSAHKYGLGIGLGSCRIILEDNTYFEDFNLRPILGDEVPFFGNIGIAQLEELIHSNKLGLINSLIEKLSADGLILHVNPLQELMQPEGDIYSLSPIEAIKILLNEIKYPLIVKEVGQGFGPKSMSELLQLPLEAIDFAAHGGTNFAKLELLRNEDQKEYFNQISNLGHNAYEMVNLFNNVLKNQKNILAKNVIISGGISNFLDGYYLTNKCQLNSIYGQAGKMLKHASVSQEALNNYVESQITGLKIAQAFLTIKE